MKKMLLVLCIIFCFLPKYGEAKVIQKQDTGRVTVKAVVPPGFNQPINLEYQEIGCSGFKYCFELNADNGYSVRQMMKAGDYQCIKKSANATKIVVNDSFTVLGEQELSVVLEAPAPAIATVGSQHCESPERFDVFLVICCSIAVVLVITVCGVVISKYKEVKR